MSNIQRRMIDTAARRHARRPVTVPLTPAIRTIYAEPDLADAYRIPRAPGTPDAPQAWADAIFRDPPPWVGALLGLRNELVRLVRIPRGTARAFDTIAVVGDELLLGQDDEHLDFRASIVVGPGTVTLSTVAKVNNRRGVAYLAVIRLVHPTIVRAMLARAGRRLATARVPSMS
jgi:hypothetical protein